MRGPLASDRAERDTLLTALANPYSTLLQPRIPPAAVPTVPVPDRDPGPRPRRTATDPTCAGATAVETSRPVPVPHTVRQPGAESRPRPAPQTPDPPAAVAEWFTTVLSAHR